MGAELSEGDVIGVYRRTIQPLYTYVSRRVGGDRMLAEDLVQETWARALDTWPRQGLPDEPLAWLIAVARNALISHFRRLRALSVDPSTIDLAAPGPLADTPTAAAVVSWGLARIGKRHSTILEAFYFDEKSVRAIASEHGLTERAVEGRLRRGRA